MIEVIITHPDRVEKDISLHEAPNNEYGIHDLNWAIYKYDTAGLYFRMPELALEVVRKQVQIASNAAMAFYAACCHTHVRGLIASSAPVKVIEPYKPGTLVRITRGCYPPNKVARIKRSRWGNFAQTHRGVIDLPGLRPYPDHPSYELEDVGVMYSHCELEPVNE